MSDFFEKAENRAKTEKRILRLGRWISIVTTWVLIVVAIVGLAATLYWLVT